MNKIRVIDLLNKIANNEEVPEKIKWEDIIYAYSDYDKDYLEFPFSDEEYRGLFCMKDSILTQFLNDEVEILEEEKKIPEKLETYKEVDDEDYFANILKVSKNGECEIDEATSVIVDKVNEIIDYLKSKGE